MASSLNYRYDKFNQFQKSKVKPFQTLDLSHLELNYIVRKTSLYSQAK